MGLKRDSLLKQGTKSFPFTGDKGFYNVTYDHPSKHLYADNTFAVIPFNNTKILYD